jgi:hypothetical protein
LGGRHALHGEGKNKPLTPTKTLIAIPEPRVNALYWAHATIAGRQGMQVVGDFTITNVSAGDLLLTLAALRYWRGLRRHVQKASTGMQLNFRGFNGPLPPGKTAGVRAAFMYVDEHRPDKPGDLKADVALVDQFNNYHWIKGLTVSIPAFPSDEASTATALTTVPCGRAQGLD